MNNTWIQRNQYTVPETSKSPLTRKQKDTLLSPIPRNLTALLSTNELMTRVQIKEFMSHLVSLNTNISFMGTKFGPGLLHHGHLYWDNIMGTKRVNTAKKARDAKEIAKHILYIMWFTGETTGGH
jgi:hypothetical protein